MQTLVSTVPFQTDDSPVIVYKAPEPAVSPSPVQGAAAEIAAPTPAPTTPGNISLSITDAPPNTGAVTAIDMTFTQVEIRAKGTGSLVSLLSAPLKLNVLNLQNGLSKLFGSVSVPAGDYTELRFFVSAVDMVMSGTTVNVAVPAELATNGIRIFGTFNVSAAGSTQLLIDFDARDLFVFGRGGWIFRPLAKLRHLKFQPSGIHFVEAPGGATMSLVGPAGTVAKRSWLQYTDPLGAVTRMRAAKDGSFEFDGLRKVYGTAEFAVVSRWGAGPLAHLFDELFGDDSPKAKWYKLAWIDLPLDFSADAQYPAILASNLDTLFSAAYLAQEKDPAKFLALFSTDTFRYLAGRYVQALGAALPAGFAFPTTLTVPYPFALEGPDYSIPDYALSENAVGFYTGGPTSSGCADARVVFEGAAPNNNYGGVSADAALARMLNTSLPFTGLLAEYEVACRSQDLAELGCGTLGSMAVAATHSLPAIPLTSLPQALNSAQGGLITALLSCVDVPASAVSDLNPVALPGFPPQVSPAVPDCWLGCANETTANYLNANALFPAGGADAIVGDPMLVLDLDSLVTIAQNANVDPLKLAASWIADHAASKVHGYVDRNSPTISNILPVDGAVTTADSIAVTASAGDRSIVGVTIGGVSVPFSLGPDGLIYIPPVTYNLVNGSNAIVIAAQDLAGNVSSSTIHVTADLVSPSPSPSPTPTVTGVSELCSTGTFEPKSGIKVGLSINPGEGSSPTIMAGLTSIGFPPTLYLDTDVISGKPLSDGITVLIISREATLGPVSQGYINAVLGLVGAGVSIVGEYDGAAMLFNTFVGANVTLGNLNPALELFSGVVSGGGVLLPILNSTFYVSDPNDPLMAGMPPSFLLGPRAAFAISGFNNSWLHVSATFTSTGYMGLVPAGTFPAVISGQCGSGRVAIFPMNDLQIVGSAPVSTLFTNTLHWVTGN